jgi:NADP-dependent 3-hydroxy acid dehydrogenase YdfG
LFLENTYYNFVSEVKSKFGKLDILILNAGIVSFSPVESASEEHYDRIYECKCKRSVFYYSKITSNFE